jgi:hypothetical protein
MRLHETRSDSRDSTDAFRPLSATILAARATNESTGFLESLAAPVFASGDPPFHIGGVGDRWTVRQIRY